MNVDNVIHQMKGFISSRMEDAEVDWNSADIHSMLHTCSKCETVKAFTEKELGVEFNGAYCFLFVNEKESDKVLEECVNEIECVFSSSEGLIDKIFDENNCSKVLFYIILKDLKTRIQLEENWKIISDEINKRLIKRIGKKRIKSKCIYSIINKENTEESYEISHIDRYSIIQEPELINTINLKKSNEETKQMGYVSSIKLYELISLYNELGDRLFDDNVRYAIGEQMDVNKAIKLTLLNNPEQFWFRNNGVTILVKAEKFNLNHPNKIVLNMKDGEESFSVINGAQTINVAAMCYFQQVVRREQYENEYSKIENNEKTKKDELKEKIDDCNNNIKKISSARILLRIIWVDKTKISTEAQEISVALNRQKPIKQVDIAYTLKYVNDLSAFAADITPNDFRFDLSKRGENALEAIDLIELSKIRLACANKPIRSRNESAIKSLGTEFDDNGELSFKDKLIFPEIEDIEDFKKYYLPIKIIHNWVHIYKNAEKQLLDIYSENLKKRISKDKKNKIKIKRTLVSNARWFMISHLAIYINGNSTDYSDFESKCDKVKKITQSKFMKMMDTYFDQFADKIKIEELNTQFFKTDDWFINIRDSIDMKAVIDAT